MIAQFGVASDSIKMTPRRAIRPEWRDSPHVHLGSRCGTTFFPPRLTMELFIDDEEVMNLGIPSFIIDALKEWPHWILQSGIPTG